MNKINLQQLNDLRQQLEELDNLYILNGSYSHGILTDSDIINYALAVATHITKEQCKTLNGN